MFFHVFPDRVCIGDVGDGDQELFDAEQGLVKSNIVDGYHNMGCICGQYSGTESFEGVGGPREFLFRLTLVWFSVWPESGWRVGVGGLEDVVVPLVKLAGVAVEVF